MLKKENSNVFVRPSKLKPLQCNVLLLCLSEEKRTCEVPLFFRMFLKTFIHETMLSAIFQESASFRSRRFPKLRIASFSEEPKRILQKSLGSSENRMTKRMGFYKKRSEVCEVYRTVFGRRVPTEWDFIFYQLYRFQKMPKRIRP